MKFYVYIHYTLDTNKPFYVGKGISTRAYKKSGRSNYWKRVINKHGYTVEILDYFNTEQEAFNREKSLICSLKNSGFKLVNFTDGGEGSSGRICSNKTKLKIGLKSKGRIHNKGFNNPSNKLSKENILDIYNKTMLGIPSVSIAKEYSISDSTVAKIKYLRKPLYKEIIQQRI